MTPIWVIVVVLIAFVIGYVLAAVIEFEEGVRCGRKSLPPCKPCNGYLDVVSSEGITVPEKTTSRIKLEAITVCVGYADILAWTLPFNKQHFDRFVVVTSSKDIATQRLCEFWHVECVVTDSFYSNGDAFNKGLGINEGLARLDLDGWVVHMDADIFLYPRTREVLELLPLDEESIYGVDRVNCFGLDQWAAYLSAPDAIHDSSGFMVMKRFENGARLLNLARDGYVPIGYFQLWNPLGSGVAKYPVKHGAADRSDTLFSYNWDRAHRHIIPELLAVHLESVEGADLGANWEGRKTPAFVLA